MMGGAGNAGSMGVRVSVVAELVEAFTAEAAGCLPCNVTAAERWIAAPLIYRRLAAACRPTREAALTLFGAYRAGDDWAAVFDRVAPVRTHLFGRPAGDRPDAARRQAAARQEARSLGVVDSCDTSAAPQRAMVVSLARYRRTRA